MLSVSGDEQFNSTILMLKIMESSMHSSFAKVLDLLHTMVSPLLLCLRRISFILSVRVPASVRVPVPVSVAVSVSLPVVVTVVLSVSVSLCPCHQNFVSLSVRQFVCVSVESGLDCHTPI